MTNSWGSPTARPLERFKARAKRALADPTIQKVTVPVAELKAALIARSRMIDGAGPLTTRYGLLDPDNYRSDP